MRPTSLIRRFPSAYTLFNRLMNLPAWIADSLGGKRKPDRFSAKLNVENMEDRIVPSTMSILYNVSDDGGVATLGLSRTLTEGQTLVVETDVAADVDGEADPASPTPTGTVSFTLSAYIGITYTTYTIGTISLTAASTGVGQAELITSDLPVTTTSFELGLSYSGDSNYSSASSSDVAEITMQSPPTGAPADLAPSSTAGTGPIQIPTGDNLTSQGVSDSGVVYGTGDIDVTRTDLTSNGFGTPWGESWDWNNGSGYTDGLSGSHATQTPGSPFGANQR